VLVRAQLVAVVVVALGVVVAGCGSSGGSTSSASASPQQLDNSQRDEGYVRAVQQIMAPFTKPPASQTDYAGAARKLRIVINQLGKLTPPHQFATSQARLVTGLRTQAALAPRFARASATHDSVTLSNLEARLLAAEQKIRAATQEMVNAYNHCRAGRFQTC
jgi:hypothetical protein